MLNGLEIKSKEGTSTLRIYPYIMAFTGDMPQQNSNGGYLKQTARYGCRFCFIHKDSLGDLEFDVSAKGRYHYEIKNRKEAMMMMRSAAHSWLAGMGILPEPPVL